MEQLISTDKIIKEAKKQGVDFGKGDPYNRLRYYTKIGWLPHMTRKIDKKGNVKGHYPTWVVDQLVLIENLKNKGYSNGQITDELNRKNKFQDIKKFLNSKEIRNQIISYVTITLLLIILSSEVGIISIGNTKNNVINSVDTPIQKQIFESGSAFVPKNQRSIYVQSNSATNSREIYVTFKNNYSPATRFWISKVNDFDGFYVELDTPTSQNAEFSWWVSN